MLIQGCSDWAALLTTKLELPEGFGMRLKLPTIRRVITRFPPAGLLLVRFALPLRRGEREGAGCFLSFLYLCLLDAFEEESTMHGRTTRIAKMTKRFLITEFENQLD